jgi:hypothetical protein
MRFSPDLFFVAAEDNGPALWRNQFCDHISTIDAVSKPKHVL